MYTNCGLYSDADFVFTFTQSTRCSAIYLYHPCTVSEQCQWMKTNGTTKVLCLWLQVTVYEWKNAPVTWPFAHIHQSVILLGQEIIITRGLSGDATIGLFYWQITLFCGCWQYNTVGYTQEITVLYIYNHIHCVQVRVKMSPLMVMVSSRKRLQPGNKSGLFLLHIRPPLHAQRHFPLVFRASWHHNTSG